MKQFPQAPTVRVGGLRDYDTGKGAPTYPCLSEYSPKEMDVAFTVY